ncbi:Nuc-1 negative regulatory protein preg [Penicillium subrubescens]|uniref:PHO85 cyclin PHO80 n=1 Tax=Penicillium subrubescens TaxID=1316194 RepID=A0A1Q5SUG5_9EURO|nr:Nuc-1 negative regulatory protein preg [Penicillium subrubescens]KAJ5911168.1 Nuc-1 negative regulatory protein preg [Penicillium subrubescens]OKO91624.1 PHO85 cyclin PHO80 [Penicillium subrubescens]
MLASSPSPSSAALRSPHPHPHPHPLPHPAGAAAHYDPSSAPQFNSPRSSRLAIEELRSALNRHTVDPSSPESPASWRRRVSTVSTASTTASVDTLAPSSALALSSGPSAATPATVPPDSAAATAPVNIPTPAAAPPTSATVTATAPSMPAPDSSGSNKRNSPSDHHPSDATAPAGFAQDGEASQTKRQRSSRQDVKILPAQYEEVDPRDLVVLISSMLMELIRFNDKIPLHQGRLTRFHSRSPPRISVLDYLQRLTTHATLSPPILLSMVYYIDRLCALYPAFTVSSLTIHRFLIVSATVASKGLSDSFWTNKTYARVGGITMNELAMLELEFLFKVQWRIVPQPEVLEDYYQSLIDRCDGFEIERTSTNHSTAPTTSTTAANTPSA